MPRIRNRFEIAVTCNVDKSRLMIFWATIAAWYAYYIRKPMEVTAGVQYLKKILPRRPLTCAAKPLVSTSRAERAQRASDLRRLRPVLWPISYWVLICLENHTTSKVWEISARQSGTGSISHCQCVTWSWWPRAEIDLLLSHLIRWIDPYIQSLWKLMIRPMHSHIYL
jgi:hypothetical protein